MSAAACLCFIRYLLIGNKVPKCDLVWQLYLQLRDLVDYLTSPRLIKGYFQIFKEKCSQFLQNYKECYKELFFKLHNLTHVLRVMEKNGSLILFWSMRYESQHRHLKAIFVSCMSKLNSLYTISLRTQLMLAYSLLFDNFSEDNIELKSSSSIEITDRKVYFQDSAELDEIISVNHVIHNGIDYADSMILVLQMGENDILRFGKVEKIFVKNKKDIFLLMRKYFSAQSNFDEHYHAYLVTDSKKFVLKKSCDLPNTHPCIMHNIKDNCYIATKYKL